MCSYKRNSDVTDINMYSDNWEEELWANVPSPIQNSYNNSQNQTQTTYQDSSALLSPTWDESTSPASYSTCMSMSSYFSTFNPQIEEDNQNPVPSTNSNTTTHHAKISFVPKNGAFKTKIMKRKRKRTVFTTEQIEALEEVFAKRPYVTRDERQLLVEKLQVNDKSVKIWFQNRRLKNKRDDQYVDMEENTSNIFERLNAVETKLFERVDTFGYVTLDDKIMTELVNVIDDYFSSKSSVVALKKEVKDSPIYEPISPASSDDNCWDVGTSWANTEPNNHTQDLMDIESILSSM